MRAVKILLADGHEVIRAGVRQFLSLQKNVRIVGETTVEAELVEQVNKKKADIVILEPVTPEIGGIKAIREYDGSPQVPIS